MGASGLLEGPRIMTGNVTSLGNHLNSLFHLVFEAGFPSLRMGIVHCSFTSCPSGLVLASADDQTSFPLSKDMGGRDLTGLPLSALHHCSFVYKVQTQERREPVKKINKHKSP